MSATAVPLRPVSKSGLTWLWAGLGLLIAAALAYALFLSNPARIGFTTVQEGTGRAINADDIVLVKYEGKLDNGTVFDANEQAPLEVAGVVPGFRQALMRMRIGGQYRVRIPAALGYGDRQTGAIPANSPLNFTVEVKDAKSRAEVEQLIAQQRMMQQMMQGTPGVDGPQGPRGRP